MNMKSCGRFNVSKHRDIKNGDKYIILEIYPKLDCLCNRKVTYSESRYYIKILGKGMTNSLDLSTKRLNKKQQARFTITEITKQDFRMLLKKFNNSPALCHNSKQVHNEPTKDYFFLIKHITNSPRHHVGWKNILLLI